MRISDWSSDVCSSDLDFVSGAYFRRLVQILSYIWATSCGQGGTNSGSGAPSGILISGALAKAGSRNASLPTMPFAYFAKSERSEELRVGKECVSQCRFRWSP